MTYDHKQIELKWQERWAEQNLYAAKNNDVRKKFYALIEFPYPSGEGLHVGHPRSYTAMDIIARKRRMEGYNVLYPIGFDSFGLPTENYAIKTGRPPAEITKENIANFTRQLKRLGFSFDWSRAVTTSDPSYYRWTQWIFLQLFKHGLAYKATMPINWCPSCKIGLANEEVVNGGCERCGAGVEEREREQWMLAITKYADTLLEGLKEVDYIERAKVQQENWIGRSEGATIEFSIRSQTNADKTRTDAENSLRKSASRLRESAVVEVFTTRPDTLFGATYLVLAPEHLLLANGTLQIANRGEVDAYIQKAKGKSELERTSLEKEKTGVELKGVQAVNPATKEEIPIWVADYVIARYGTGAIMAVPAHDERDFAFAKKFNLPVREVVRGGDGAPPPLKVRGAGGVMSEAYTGVGIMVHSGPFDGLGSENAKWKITEAVGGKKTVQYKLRDWVFSRQRYWGEPIPLVHCAACAAWVPINEDQLPLELPYVEKYQPTDTGESPLAAMREWVQTTCPKCQGPARRETDTMPNWAGSSWYFLRYCDPGNTTEFASKETLRYWMPVDWYNGGMEHTVLHLLYSRFWNQFLYDIGVVPTREPYAKRTSHGLIMAEDGEKMSKSRGNVVNPDEVIEKVGADTLRLYEMFMGPFDQAVPWSTNGIMGVHRFIQKVFRLFVEAKFQITKSKSQTNSKLQNPKSEATDRLLHKTLKKVTEDIETMKFNTAISAMMIFVNTVAAEDQLSKVNGQMFLKILAPFTPHLAEELWEHLGHTESIFKESWPTYDPVLVKDEEIELVIQVNGKVRDRIRVSADISEDDAKTQALASEKVKPWILGKKVERVVFVKGKLVNIVTSP